MKIHDTPQYLREGYLLSLLQTLRNKGKIKKLDNQHLTHIATILGRLSKDHNLYELLFEQPNQKLEIKNLVVNTKDLAAFVLLDHTYTRGYFAKTAARTAMLDTTNSQGVPLALEGAKRLYGKKYMDWLKDIDLTDYNQVWRLDVFLPAQLASFELDEEGGVKQSEKYGLLVLYNNKIEYPKEVITSFRERIENWETAINPRQLKKRSDKERRLVNIYNSCSYKMRCMILRGWIWSEVCRNDDMITDWLDWDKHPETIMFEGLTPKTNKNDPLMTLLGVS